MSKQTNSISTFRRGVAAVEAAVCLPVVFIIVFGAVEITSGIFQQHVLRSAVHETAKIASRGTSTVADCQAVCTDILDQRGFPDPFTATLSVIPRGDTSLGTDVNVGSIPADVNDVASGFPITFTDSAAPSTRIDLPRGTIMQLTISTPRPDLAGTLLPNILPNTVDATTVFVKRL